MRIYLSGPMTGIPDYNYPAFHAAAKALRDSGLDVDNPAEHYDGNQGLDRATYLRGDIEALLKVDAVVKLDGWHKSQGAQLELSIARALDLPIFRLDEMLEQGACTVCFAPRSMCVLA